MSDRLRGEAPAKLNLALVVGPRCPDGKHEVATVLERLALHDLVEVRRSSRIAVDGFPADTIVTRALTALRDATGQTLAASVEKRIPVAAGLGGGSTDAASALTLGNRLLGDPLDAARLHAIAATLGADVPFLLAGGAQLGTGDGSTLEPLELPTDYHVVLVHPDGEHKDSTAAVYRRFDERGGEVGFAARRAALQTAVGGLVTAADLAALPANDLASSPVAGELLRLGAFRADVTGAGPIVFGLFDDADRAVRAAAELGSRGHTWVTRPTR